MTQYVTVPTSVRRTSLATEHRGELTPKTPAEWADGGLSFKLSRETRSILTKTLQEWFVVSQVTSNWRWNVNPKDSKVQIMAEVPPVDVRYPLIAVLARPFSEAQIIIGRNQGQFEDNDVSYVQKGGSVELPVTIEIQARSADDRDSIADLAALGLATYGTEVMQSRGWLVLHNVIALSAQQDADSSGEPLFTATLTFTLQVNWTQVWSIPSETLEKIRLSPGVEGVAVSHTFDLDDS